MDTESEETSNLSLEDNTRRIKALEEQLSRSRSFWRDRSLVPVIIAVIGLAAPLTTLVLTNAQQEMKRIEYQREADLKELELKRTIQMHYVEKAAIQDDEALRQRILRFLVRAGDTELKAWANEEYRLSQELVRIEEEKERAAEKIKDFDTEIKRLSVEVTKSKASGAIKPDNDSRNALRNVKSKRLQALKSVAVLNYAITPEPTLLLQNISCKNAQTLGGGLDHIKVLVDGLTAWEGPTCGGKTGAQGSETQTINKELKVIGKCAQIKILELDSGRNDSLGTSTVCIGSEPNPSPPGNLVFSGGSFWKGGKYRYELSYSFIEPAQIGAGQK